VLPGAVTDQVSGRGRADCDLRRGHLDAIAVVNPVAVGSRVGDSVLTGSADNRNDGGAMASDEEEDGGGREAASDDEEGGERGGRRMSDTVRKALASGFRSVRASEERLRGMVGDAMPKELVVYLKGAIDNGRDEIVRIIGTQTKKFLEGIDVGGEVAKILTAVSFEIRTEIRFIPNDQKIKPSIRTSIKPKKAAPKSGEPEDEA